MTYCSFICDNGRCKNKAKRTNNLLFCHIHENIYKNLPLHNKYQEKYLCCFIKSDYKLCNNIVDKLDGLCWLHKYSNEEETANGNQILKHKDCSCLKCSYNNYKNDYFACRDFKEKYYYTRNQKIDEDSSNEDSPIEIEEIAPFEFLIEKLKIWKSNSNIINNKIKVDIYQNKYQTIYYSSNDIQPYNHEHKIKIITLNFDLSLEEFKQFLIETIPTIKDFPFFNIYQSNDNPKTYLYISLFGNENKDIYTDRLSYILIKNQCYINTNLI